MKNSKFSMLIDGEKLFADLEEETSYEEYCVYKIKKTGEGPSIVDYIKYLEEELTMAKKIIDIRESSWVTNKRLLEEIVKLKEKNEELKEKLNQSTNP